MTSNEYITLITREGKFHLDRQRVNDPAVFLRKWARRTILAGFVVGLILMAAGR